jgi:hypothetical protein
MLAREPKAQSAIPPTYTPQRITASDGGNFHSQGLHLEGKKPIAANSRRRRQFHDLHYSRVPAIFHYSGNWANSLTGSASLLAQKRPELDAVVNLLFEIFHANIEKKIAYEQKCQDSEK